MASTGGRVQDPWDAEFIALRNWAQGDDGVTLTRSPQLGAERYRVKLTVNANHNNDIEERLIPIIHGSDAVGEMDLELLSGWWHWPEFTILRNGRGHKLKTCEWQASLSTNILPRCTDCLLSLACRLFAILWRL
jgi:hypothetical protein